MRKIRIGTRKSKLALIQAEMVRQSIAEVEKNVEIEIVGITTEGDMLSAGNKISEKGLFVKSIEEQILSNKIDVAVHSVKDMPAVIPEGLMLAAFLKREDARDVFITSSGKKLSSIEKGFKVGTSSPRRRALLLKNYKGIDVVNIRGNIDTRLKKLQQGEVDGLVLAAAGIIRLGYADVITEYFPLNTFIPSGGQGAVGVEISSGDKELSELMQSIDDYETRIAVSAERAFILGIGAGCNVPVGVHCEISGEEAILKCAIFSKDGVNVLSDEIRNDAESAESSGRLLARKMIEKGAEEFIKN